MKRDERTDGCGPVRRERRPNVPQQGLRGGCQGYLEAAAPPREFLRCMSASAGSRQAYPRFIVGTRPHLLQRRVVVQSNIVAHPLPCNTGRSPLTDYPYNSTETPARFLGKREGKPTTDA